MRRVLVLGCPGSGKSTFAKKLSECTGLPLYHMDILYWKSDWTHIDEKELTSIVKEITNFDKWIIDGNYLYCIDDRIEMCDTVFFLDFPVDMCIEGVRARLNKKRDDMPCIEIKEDPELMEMIRNFPTDGRQKIIELMRKYNDKKWIVVEDREELNAFLK